jgi:hypothetical protein
VYEQTGRDSKPERARSLEIDRERAIQQQRVTVTSGGNVVGLFWKIAAAQETQKAICLVFYRHFLICSHFAVGIESSTANTEISSLFLAGLSPAMASLRCKAICVPLSLPCVHGESLGPSGTLFAAMRLTL